MDQRLKDSFARLHLAHVGQYSVLSVDPPIFYVQFWLDALEQFLPGYRLLFDHLRGRKAYCLCCYSWNITQQVLRDVQQLEQRRQAEFPDIEFVHLCNEPGQVEQFDAFGARAIYCSQNSFVDESAFRLLPDREKRFDAVYNSRLTPWKRHVLAAEISRLAVIYYPSPHDSREASEEIRRRLAHAYYLNHPGGAEYRYLSREEINRGLNAARTGLCLSAEEGAMYASMEYLLAGLPIVTTTSQGGRDVFFEPDFVATVEADPGAVRAAVEELPGRAPAAEDIRARTLAKVWQHRDRFIELVQSIYDAHGAARDFRGEWPRVFHHGMTRTTSHLETIALLRQAEARGQRMTPPEGQR